MIAAQIKHPVTGQKIQITAAFDIPEISPAGLCIAFVKADDLQGAGKTRVHMSLIKRVIFALVSGHKLFDIKGHGGAFQLPVCESAKCRALSHIYP